MRQNCVSNLEEKDILLRCQMGDCREYGRVAIQYRGRLMGLACKYLRDEDEAEDMSQDVFLQGLLKIHRYDISRDFKTWLCTIAVRRSIDKLRRNRLFLNFMDRESKRVLQETRERKDSPGHWRGIAESELFAPLLEHLSDRQREALLMNMDEGYSSIEIAERLNCSASTVRGYLFGARRILRKHLKNLEGERAEYLRLCLGKQDPAAGD